MPRPKRDPEREDVAAWDQLEQWRELTREQTADVVQVVDLLDTDLPMPRKREAPAD